MHMFDLNTKNTLPLFDLFSFKDTTTRRNKNKTKTWLNYSLYYLNMFINLIYSTAENFDFCNVQVCYSTDTD